MTNAIIVVALCYIIPTILALLLFKYSEIGKAASDDVVLRSFIPIVNISYAIIIISVSVVNLLPKPSFVDNLKRKVLKFVRGK